MTIVLTEISNQPVVPSCDGNNWEILCGLTFSSTYKTGGDATLAAAIETVLKELGQGLIQWVQVSGIAGYIFTFNYATNKLMATDTGSASGEPLKELPEAEYPAAIREVGKARLFAMGI